MTWTQAQQAAETVWHDLRAKYGLANAIKVVSALLRQVRPKKGAKP